MGQIKKICALAVLFTFITFIPANAMAESLKTGELEIGNYIQFGSYKGAPVLWQVVNNDQNGTMLFSENIISFKAFDAKGDSADGRDSQYNNRVLEGSNYWTKSNLREWLNSADEKVAYSHQKPDAQHVLDFGTEDLSYDKEAGYLTNFSQEEISMIQAVRHKLMLSSFDLQLKDGGSQLWNPGINNDDAYFQWVTDKVFLLSYDELTEWISNNGLPIKAPWYTFKDRSVLDTYWLRSPDGDYASTLFNVSGGRIGSNTNAYRALGVRPALCLKSGLAVSGNGTKENPYLIETAKIELQSPAAADEPVTTKQEITININNKILQSDVPPTIIEGRTMVPVRAIFEALGIGVQWIPESRTVVGISGNTKIQLTIDNKKALLNNKEVLLDVPATIIDGRTLVPVRFIAESTGQEVGWDGESRTVSIKAKQSLQEENVPQGQNSVREFKIDQEGPIYLSVGESKRVSATVTGEGLSYEEEYPRWGTSNMSIANISGEVVSGYTNTWGGETQRFIVTADKAVYVKGLSPGQITLSASIGPYTGGQSQTRKITVIVFSVTR